MKSLLLKSYFKYKNLKYKQQFNHKILSKIAQMEKEKGKTDPRLFKLADEYALDIFGNIIYAPWLYVYTVFAGEFKEGWIPWNYYKKYIIPKKQGNYGGISTLSALHSVLFNSDLFPDKFYFANGLWMDKNYNVIEENKIKEHLFQNTSKIVFKTDDSKRGYGVYVYNSDNINFNEIKSLGNGIIQNYIVQHKFFDEIMPNSVGTIRLTTATDKYGQPSVRAASIKVANANETHVNADTAIFIPADLKIGVLEDGYNHHWNTMKQHPDTGYIFKGNQIPNFRKCVETALDLHAKVPFARIVGWDLTINSENEPVLIEWNGRKVGIEFPEASQGPIFKGYGFENTHKEA